MKLGEAFDILKFLVNLRDESEHQREAIKRLAAVVEEHERRLIRLEAAEGALADRIKAAVDDRILEIGRRRLTRTR